VSDLLTSVGSSKTRASPQWSPASFNLVASSHDSVSPSHSARGLHAPGKSLPGPARVGHSLSSKARLGVFSMDPRSSSEFLLLRRSPVGPRVSPATAPPDAGLDLCFWFKVFYFFF
jgi:hypothetical protein